VVTAVELDEPDGDEEVGLGQAQIVHRIQGGEVAEVRCEERDQAIQRSICDGSCLWRRGGDVAGDDLGEDLLPGYPWIPRRLHRFKLEKHTYSD